MKNHLFLPVLNLSSSSFLASCGQGHGRAGESACWIGMLAAPEIHGRANTQQLLMHGMMCWCYGIAGLHAWHADAGAFLGWTAPCAAETCCAKLFNCYSLPPLLFLLYLVLCRPVHPFPCH